jgi:hypothetical protein
MAENHRPGGCQPQRSHSFLDLSKSYVLASCLQYGRQRHAGSGQQEEKKMKTKLFALVLLAGGCLLAQPRIYAGVGYGYAAPAPVAMRYAPPAPLVSYATPMPAPGYSWVGGYWYPNAGRYAWHAGYWARPAFAGARWYGPRYTGGRYYHGYWRR